jgi:hypothetical protein
VSKKPPTGKQILKRISPDGEVLYTEEKEIGAFDRFPEDKGYIMIASNRKLMHLVRPSFPEGTKPRDIGELVELCRKYLSPRGLLMGQHFPIKKQELPEVMQLHRNSVHTFLARMEDLGVLRLVNDYVYVNPLYLTSNTYLPAELYHVFAKELEPHLPDWVIKRYKMQGVQ